MENIMERSPKILLIEDEGTVAGFMIRAFDRIKSCPAEMELVHPSARERIRELISQRPCAVILDYGCDSEGVITRSSAEDDIPVFLISGYGPDQIYPEMEERGLRPGKDFHFQQKPFTLTAVQEIFGRVCQNCRYRITQLDEKETE